MVSCYNLYLSCSGNFLPIMFVLLDVRSLVVASRCRQSEKQPVVDELALIAHAHMGMSFRASRTVATCHG